MANKIRNIITLLRVRQYYKNVLIFVSIFFSKRLFDFSLYIPLIFGFILLCCTSSFNYIINDIIDIEYDKKHTEKLKKKPLASGDLSIYFAVAVLIVLIAITVMSLLFLIPNWDFALMIILIVITGQVYNHFLKNYAFIDILILSTGYLWRALAGCMIIEEFISAWLFLVIFEIAMFLSIAKRKGDLQFLGKDKAIEHKKVYDQYSIKLLDQFHVMIAGSLFMTYSLYLILKFNLFEQESVNLWEYSAIFTIPILFYIIMRYTYLTSAKPEIARRPERAFLDKSILIAGFIFLATIFITFYFEQIISFFSSL
ncbi:MAG: UbiA family prenyltransferase [Candidatus Lokiarchaeota archaeon]|nr:UbiA family prenyltransferase [Candidatus Lokiarchaeota archaeon]